MYHPRIIVLWRCEAQDSGHILKRYRLRAHVLCPFETVQPIPCPNNATSKSPLRTVHHGIWLCGIDTELCRHLLYRTCAVPTNSSKKHEKLYNLFLACIRAYSYLAFYKWQRGGRRIEVSRFGPKSANATTALRRRTALILRIGTLINCSPLIFAIASVYPTA